jgi:hypothetical protein
MTAAVRYTLSHWQLHQLSNVVSNKVRHKFKIDQEQKHLLNNLYLVSYDPQAKA